MENKRSIRIMKYLLILVIGIALLMLFTYFNKIKESTQIAKTSAKENIKAEIYPKVTLKFEDENLYNYIKQNITLSDIRANNNGETYDTRRSFEANSDYAISISFFRGEKIIDSEKKIIIEKSDIEKKRWFFSEVGETR